MVSAKIIKKVLPWVIYALVGYFMVSTLYGNIDEVRGYQFENGWLLVPAMLLFSANFLMNSVAWAVLMNFVKAPISFLDSFYVYVSTFIIRYIPGSVWAVAARAAMNREYGVKVATSIWGWVIENVTYLLVGLFLSVFVIGSFNVVSPAIVAVAVAALLASSLFLLKYELLERFVRIVAQKRFSETIKGEVAAFRLTLSERFSLTGMFALSWVFFSVQFCLVVWAVTGIDGISIPELIGINALAWSLGYISVVTPSGAGVRESVMIVGLTTICGIGSVDALVIAILARMTSIVGEVLVWGAVKLAYFFIIKNENYGESHRKGN